MKISRVLLVLFSLAMVGCDHATKWAANALLRNRTVDLVPGVLDLEYTENHDVAFSVLRGVSFPHKGLALLALASVGSILVATLWYRRRALASRVEHLGWALTFAGAVGNLVDRAARGYVIDFIHLTRWPVFNVADIVVVLGVLLLMFARRPHTPPAG